LSLTYVIYLTINLTHRDYSIGINKQALWEREKIIDHAKDEHSKAHILKIFTFIKLVQLGKSVLPLELYTYDVIIVYNCR